MYQPPQIQSIGQHHDTAFPTGHLVTAVREKPEEQAAGHEDGEIYRTEASDGKRLDRSTSAQDEEDVEDVAAHDIADGQSALSLASSHDACGQFGQTGAKGHNRQADDHFRYAEPRGQAHSSVRKFVGTDQYELIDLDK